MKVPEVRVFVDPDNRVPSYAVVKGPRGWHGAPGLRKGQFLTDADVTGPEWVPLQPGPSAVVDVRYSADKQFGDDSLCDVDVNGKAGARRVSPFVAGAFIVSAAVQKEGEPIMVRAARKVNAPVALAKPGLSLVRDRDGG